MITNHNKTSKVNNQSQRILIRKQLLLWTMILYFPAFSIKKDCLKQSVGYFDQRAGTQNSHVICKNLTIVIDYRQGSPLIEQHSGRNLFSFFTVAH